MAYTYGDANWKDKLTAYDGKTITYDAIGNPLAYDGWKYTWKAGRMLHSMVKSGVNATFTYDHTGLRVKKSVNGVDTLYTMNGKRVTYIRKGLNGATGPDAIQMHFFYDAQGRPVIAQYNGVDYAYLHNLQGDVTGIIDMNGKLVVQYVYDAWGRPMVTEGSMAGTLGKDNPFRYRGYVWDEETGLYATATRYYDPEWGRFINVDTVLGKTGKLLDHNLFSYCRQNPIMFDDPSGQSPGDMFNSVEDAVYDFAYYFQEGSIAVDYEYATFIYKFEQKVPHPLNPSKSMTVAGFTYYMPWTDMKRSSVQATSVVNKHKNTFDIVATAHIHPFIGSGSYNFSDNDKKNAVARGKDNFVITPGGEIKRYDYIRRSVSVLKNKTFHDYRSRRNFSLYRTHYCRMCAN